MKNFQEAYETELQIKSNAEKEQMNDVSVLIKCSVEVGSVKNMIILWNVCKKLIIKYWLPQTQWNQR